MDSSIRYVNSFGESTRLKALRMELVKKIPRVPNNKASLEHMQSKGLPQIIVDYVNWASRYVAPRPRAVTVEVAAMVDPRWRSISTQIDVFLEKVRRGDDLSPHLSWKVFTNGYAQMANVIEATIEEKWLDKDFELNSKGYHHFHLGTEKLNNGLVRRTNELLFAKVTREDFLVVAIFDHEVFEADSVERSRLMRVHEEVAFRDLPPGAYVARGNVVTSGHSEHVVRYAQHCSRIIKEIDPKLDDINFVKTLYQPQSEAPIWPKPRWEFDHLDLTIFDKAKPARLIFVQGWN